MQNWLPLRDIWRVYPIGFENNLKIYPYLPILKEIYRCNYTEYLSARAIHNKIAIHSRR